MKNNSSKYIFLDFDGVLRRFTSPLHKLESHLLSAFEQTVLAIPHARIVITSSWKYDLSLDEIRSLFTEELRERIVGVTEDSVSLNGHYRQAEVMEYLEKSSVARRDWIAIDDSADLYPHDCNVIVTDPHVGFDQIAKKKLITFLSN